MSEILKYLNQPSTIGSGLNNNNHPGYHYSNENKTSRAFELLNKFNEYENEKSGGGDKLKKTKNMINANIPFKNYQCLNAKWLKCDGGLNGDSVLFSNDMRTVMFYPNKSYGACAVRSDLVLKRNAYSYWQVTIPDRLFGTSIMVGVGTNKAKLSSIAYINLLGSDQFSWGLSHKGILWHSNKSKVYCTQIISDNNNNNNCVNNNYNKIGCLYDGYRKTLSYFINDVYMGVAFENVDNVRSGGNDQTDTTGLYPMVSSTVSQSIVKFDFFYQTFPSLQDICRTNMTRNETLFNSIKLEYPYLPKFIIEYLEN